jgi:hypothetical protein
MPRNGITKQVAVTPAQDERLRRLALRLRVSQSEILRQTLEYALEAIESGRLQVGCPR